VRDDLLLGGDKINQPACSQSVTWQERLLSRPTPLRWNARNAFVAKSAGKLARTSYLLWSADK
jgi:hypothetical protein